MISDSVKFAEPTIRSALPDPEPSELRGSFEEHAARPVSNAVPSRVRRVMGVVIIGCSIRWDHCGVRAKACLTPGPVSKRVTRQSSPSTTRASTMMTMDPASICG